MRQCQNTRKFNTKLISVSVPLSHADTAAAPKPKRCRKEATLPSPEFLVAAPAKHRRRDLLSSPFEFGLQAVLPLMEFQ